VVFLLLKGGWKGSHGGNIWLKMEQNGEKWGKVGFVLKSGGI
jgi:hypothetical protein